LAGISVGASVYRRVVARRRLSPEARGFLVRVRVDKELVEDLVDFVRALQGRAVLEGENTLSVPLARGASRMDVYRDLRAALDKWELRHPGVRVSILDGEDDFIADGPPHDSSARGSRGSSPLVAGRVELSAMPKALDNGRRARAPSSAPSSLGCSDGSLEAPRTPPSA
jgi:hypothetical protein